MMKSLVKLTFVIFAVTVFSCGDELFDTASRYAEGVNLITALVQGAAGGDVIVTDGRDYYRQWSVFASAPAISDSVFMDRGGRIYVAQGSSDIFVYSGNEGWKSTAGVGIVYGFAGGDKESAIVLGEDFNIYGYSDGAWKLETSPGKSCTGFFSASDNSDSYLVYSDVGNTYFYYPHDTSTPVAEVTGIADPIFYDRVDGVFYAGISAATSQLGTSDDSTIYSITMPQSVHSFAVINSHEIYAGGSDNGTPVIFRINFEIATPAFEIVYNGFSLSPGTVCMSVLDSGHLAVGINGATTDNGLYIFSTSDRKLRRVSSLPVWALYVRR